MGDEHLAQQKFEELYDRFVERLYRFAFLKTSSKEQAEDIVSQTFTRCWEHILAGKAIEHPSGFLYAVARNLITDHYRKKGKNESVALSSELIAPADTVDYSIDMEAAMTALKHIRDEYQDLIIWRYIDELEIAEIAKIAGKSEEAVRMQLSRALQALREKLS